MNVLYGFVCRQVFEFPVAEFPLF